MTDTTVLTGADVRQIRERLGLSQRALGKALGVATNTVWRWETGEYPVESPEMLALALECLERRSDHET